MDAGYGKWQESLKDSLHRTKSPTIKSQPGKATQGFASVTFSRTLFKEESIACAREVLEEGEIDQKARLCQRQLSRICSQKECSTTHSFLVSSATKFNNPAFRTTQSRGGELAASTPGEVTVTPTVSQVRTSNIMHSHREVHAHSWSMYAYITAERQIVVGLGVASERQHHHHQRRSDD